ncbi:MAG: hypothetical protein GQ569_01910 [Methylococcaceae bacterium]|nr:hypothetical protein [Methylococcaceae bacterium]
MTEETAEKDYFAFYVAGLAMVIIAVIGAIKMSENEKFAPIKEQLKEESSQMNIRVISKEDYQL